MTLLKPERASTSNLSPESFYPDFAEIFRIFFKQGEYEGIVPCFWVEMR